TACSAIEPPMTMVLPSTYPAVADNVDAASFGRAVVSVEGINGKFYPVYLGQRLAAELSKTSAKNISLKNFAGDCELIGSDWAPKRKNHCRLGYEIIVDGAPYSGCVTDEVDILWMGRAIAGSDEQSVRVQHVIIGSVEKLYLEMLQDISSSLNH